MDQLNLSETTITRGIRKLRNQQYITRKGSDKSDILVITEKGNQEWRAYETK